MSTFKRIMSFVLAMVTVAGMLPASHVHADETEEHEHQVVETVPATMASPVETAAAPTILPEETAPQEETEAPTEPTVPVTEENVPETEMTVPDEVVDGEIIDDDSVDKVYPSAFLLTLGRTYSRYLWGNGKSSDIDRLKFVISNSCEVTVSYGSDNFDFTWGIEAEDDSRVSLKFVSEYANLSGRYKGVYSGTLKAGTYYITVYDMWGSPMYYDIRVDAPGGNHEHSWKTRTVAPTCTSRGYTEKYCTGCDESSKYDYVDTIPHKEVRADREEPTCTKPGKEKGTKCSSCGKTMSGREEIPKLPHDTKVEIPRVEPTCSTVGKTTGAKCSVCGTVSVKPEDIPALPHTEKDVAYVPATCTATGLTAGTKCSVCDAVVQAQEVVPKLPHTEVNAPGIAATCTTDGKADVKICSVCQKEVAYTTIPKLGHNAVDYFCLRCGKVDDAVVSAYGDCGDTVQWFGLKDGTMLIRGAGKMWDNPSIPSSANYKKIVIEEGITYIGKKSFDNCSVTSVSIPGSVSRIGEMAFSGCWLLKSITIPYGVTFIGNKAFYQCSGLASVSFPESLLEIEEYAFAETGLETLNFPKNLAYIGGSAFYKCTKITEVSIPDLVYSLGGSAFASCTSLEKVTIGDKLDKILTETFIGCRKLKSLKLGKNIKEIRNGAFQNNTALTGLFLPDGIEYIETDAFASCGLRTIYIPRSIKIIGSDAFWGCGALMEVRYGGTESQWNSTSGAWQLEGRNVYIYYTTFSTTNGLTWSVFHNKLKFSGSGSIKDYSSASSAPWYSSRSSIRELEIGANVSAIGQNAFNGYTNLKGICFLGSAPAFADDTVFRNVTATVYYPGADKSWTEEVRQNYGGTLTWVAYCPGGHKNSVEDPAVAATCTQPGFTEGYHCADCGTVTYAQIEIQALGHKFLTEKGVAPTCTESGLSDGVHCAHCGLVQTAQEVIPALGHTPKTDAALAPTCEQRGLTEGSHCDVCQVILVQQEVVPVTGHNKVAMPDVPATCYEKGSVGGIHCATCGRIFELPRRTPMLSHETEIIPAVAPTCTEDGATEGTRCKNCGDIYDAPQTVPALGHDMISDEEVSPTCTEPGHEAGAHCSRCDYTEGCNVIPALGHNEVVDAYVAPTCTGTGLTEGSHCDRCGEVLIAQEVIPALGHDFADGFCDRCGAPDKADYDLFSGKSLTLKPINPDTGKPYTAKQLTWSMDSRYEAFATLKNGKVTARVVLAKTRIEVMATRTDNGEIAASYSVDIFPAVTQLEVLCDGEVVNGKTLTVDFDQKTLVLTADAYPLDTLKDIQWTVSDKKLAYAEDYIIDGNTVTVVNPTGKAGSVTVTATVNAGTKKTATIKLQFAKYAQEVQIETPARTTIEGGESLQLYAAVIGGTSKPGITWSIPDKADKTAASISAKGLLKAKQVKQPETITVLAASKDGKAQSSVEITILPSDYDAIYLMYEGMCVTGMTTTLNVGGTSQLKAHSQRNGEETVTWKSSKPSVAIVSSDGLITAVGVGSAKITAEKPGEKAVFVNVKVTTLVSDMTISTKDGKNLVTDNGETMVEIASSKGATLAATVYPTGANKAVTWEIIEGSQYAKISSSGKLTANKDLTSVKYVTVRATAKDGSGYSETIRVRIRPLATGVQIYSQNNGRTTFSVRTPENWWVRSNTTLEVSLRDNGTLKLLSHVYPYYGEDNARNAIQGVTWKSSSTKIATIDADGTVTFLNTGTVTITATAGDGSGKKVTFKLKIV